ncbi:hypothetical protein ACFE04_021409 [Oxalis oulophora]
MGWRRDGGIVAGWWRDGCGMACGGVVAGRQLVAWWLRLIYAGKQLADDKTIQALHHSDQVCNFFRKPSKNKNIRKRAIPEDEDEDDESKTQDSLLNNLKKTPKTNSKLSFSTGPSKNNSTTATESNTFHFESSKEIQVNHDSKATATLETETDISRDSRAIRERALKQADEALRGKKRSDDKLYKGIHAYTDHKAGFRREQTISSEKAGGSHGPLRASAHIRVYARFDYQPDICKDYKETGYCAYGDSCKFMHDRGDYKPGWQMKKEWDEAEKARKRKLAMGGKKMLVPLTASLYVPGTLDDSHNVLVDIGTG